MACSCQSCGGVMEAEAWATGTIASEVRKMGVGSSYWAQHPSLCSGSFHSKMTLPTSIQLTHLLPLLCPEACLLDDSEIQTRLTISSSYSINIKPFQDCFPPHWAGLHTDEQRMPVSLIKTKDARPVVYNLPFQFWLPASWYLFLKWFSYSR